MCWVVDIQMDKFQMNKFLSWAQNTLQTAMHKNIINPHPTHLDLIYLDSLGFKAFPSLYITNTLLILMKFIK